MNGASQLNSPAEGQTLTVSGHKSDSWLAEPGTRLVNSLQNKTATVGVVGLGYVGLPLANLFHEKGFQVVGFDIDKSKVNSLNAGRSYIGHIPSSRIADLVGNDRFIPTTDFSKIRAVDTVSI